MNENAVRYRNYLIAIMAIIIVVGGAFVVADNFDFGGFGSQDDVVVTSEPVCVENIGDYFTGVCALDHTHAVMVALGQSPETPVEVTITTERETVTAMSDYVIEQFVADDEVEPTPEPTIAPTATPTIVQTPEPSTGDDTVELDFSSFPTRVVPYRTTLDHEQETHIPGTEFILGDPGVYGVLDIDHVTNPSAIYMDPDSKYVLTTDVESVNLPEDGYLFASGAGFDIDVCGLYTMSFPDFSEYQHEWQIVLRGRNWIDGVDGNCQVTFSNYTNGFVQVQRFPVERGANGFFSAEYVQQQVDNAIGGNRGYETAIVSLFGLDVNDGAYSLVAFQDGDWDDEPFSTNLDYRRLYND